MKPHQASRSLGKPYEGTYFSQISEFCLLWRKLRVIFMESRGNVGHFREFWPILKELMHYLMESRGNLAYSGEFWPILKEFMHYFEGIQGNFRLFWDIWPILRGSNTHYGPIWLIWGILAYLRGLAFPGPFGPIQGVRSQSWDLLDP